MDDESVEDVQGVMDEASMNEQSGERMGPYNLQPRQPREYSHLHVTLELTALTQLRLEKGLQTFGEAGTEAVLKELEQLHIRGVLAPVTANLLSPEQKKLALP
jgi:hypothetical protein